jgi:hypothetical protein
MCRIPHTITNHISALPIERERDTLQPHAALATSDPASSEHGAQSTGTGTGRRPQRAARAQSPEPDEQRASTPSYPKFSWGACWAPPRSQVPSNVIKRAHAARLGRPLGPWRPPRATPRLGGAAVSCQYPPSCSPLHSPCARPAFDWGSKPPSRSALAPVGSSPGTLTRCPFHRLFILDCLSCLTIGRAAK